MSKKRTNANVPFILVSALVIVLCIAVTYLFFFNKRGTVSSPTNAWQGNGTLHRELASKLKSVGLNREAIRAYEDYFYTAGLDKRTRANSAYTVGKLYMEEGNYEKALSWLYRVDIIDPDTTLKSELNAKIVHCLEELGKYHAAEYALDARSTLVENPAEEQKGEKIVAEIGDRKITLAEVDKSLHELPPWIQEQFKTKEQRVEFLKKYVADELFYRKAQKLEYDKDPDLRKKTALFIKQQMINRVLEEELKDQKTVQEDDLINYFKANTDTYKERAQAHISLIKVKTEEHAQTIIKYLEEGKDFATLAQEFSQDKTTAKGGGKWDGWITEGNDDLGIGNVTEISKAIFSTPQGTISPVIPVGDYFYIFKIEEKKPERMRDYEEVKEWVKNDYLSNKLKLAYQRLLEQMVTSSEVKLYPQVITEEGTPSS
jgi:peptidyl-prolyl cis-trans isomerase C